MLVPWVKDLLVLAFEGPGARKPAALTHHPKAPPTQSPHLSPHSVRSPGEAVRHSGKILKPDHLGSNVKSTTDKTM